MKKTVLTLVAVAVVALAIVIVGPVLYKLIAGDGPKTEGINAEGAPPASTDRNGTWAVAEKGSGHTSQVGFTFQELLPGSERTTSGSTSGVTGEFTVADDTLTAGHVAVDMTTLTSDIEKRDINVRMTIFSTDRYPEATFDVAGPVDLTPVPDDGSMVRVEVPGRLTIRGVTNDVTVPMDVVRTGDNVLMSGIVRINRLDYNVRTPDFVAAKVEDEGDINIRLVLEK
ncbi:YceI family protein [Corynebacterium sp.]|uniref:YceI family protein n=1 Tax=Corynebacterium sp. TaxID=1720 RepID=UPI0026DACF1E|nr:YceI family protein [Corynebacterium sp.]MDO4609311.1 YceI family protein [Corynebacterium sp.]